MKYITQTTENRIMEMVKADHKYGVALLELLNEMKGREGCYGASVKQMKDWGIRLDNATQISIPVFYLSNLYRGIGIVYSNLFHATYCADLHHADIYDFNELVKVMHNLPCNGWEAI